ncbi:PIG-L deacetylase family protein [Brevibacillus sp. TJ4]|uniref:PIG-L deacetylase family protein n=1 Tax=Brevibacillus sp. TJ4 TaxID=3234853 RepID=UPI0037CDD4DF
MKKIMAVFPHPDDESFACGGTLARFHEQGVPTCLLCLTSGCGGKSGAFSFPGRAELARHRERELARAAEVLGISRLELFRYPDGSLAAQEQDELARRIRDTIVDWKPTVVITFPPDGVTGHRDHIVTCHATTQAVMWAEEQLAQEEYPDLYYVSIPNYYDHCQDQGPQPAVPITGKVDITQYRQRKGEALRAHQSQVYSLNRAFPGVIEGDFGVIGSYEYYTLVRSKGKPVEPIAGVDGIPLIEL